MAGPQSSTAHAADVLTRAESAKPRASQLENGLKAFLTALMGLLTIFVFGLGLERRDALWLWIAFFCALVSGIFVQLLISRDK